MEVGIWVIRSTSSCDRLLSLWDTSISSDSKNDIFRVRFVRPNSCNSLTTVVPPLSRGQAFCSSNRPLWCSQAGMVPTLLRVLPSRSTSPSHCLHNPWRVYEAREHWEKKKRRGTKERSCHAEMGEEKKSKKLSTVALLQKGYYGKIFFGRILGPCYYPDLSFCNPSLYSR